VNVILTIAHHSFLEAFHNRLIGFIGVFFLLVFLVTEFIGKLAIAETVLFQSAFLGALLRFSGVVIISLIVITSMAREFSDKGLWLILSARQQNLWVSILYESL